ncbi:sugar ABC transporter permease [Microbacterium sp. No. 7]|uniref:sugar ABC transporter permease n=1 Tax=Microbacterium sp. No. 7 TaxID=1714373 RepID=UPI0006ED0C98|nr:ABC transporter permease [Microbacterium sp. No. 7]ALJ21755.1 hypothetical protein AOA12_18395 [Microbacterium sp. No. 7]
MSGANNGPVPQGMTETPTGRITAAIGTAADRSGPTTLTGLLRSRAGLLREMAPVLLALVAIWIIFAALNPVFLSPRNISFLLVQTAVLGIIAIGVGFVLLIGEIDLSCATTAGISAAVLAVLLQNAGFDPWVAVLVALCAAVVIGLFLGVFVAIVGVPSFIATLAALLGFNGVMLWVLGGAGTVNMGNAAIRALATTYLPPALTWALAAVVAVAAGAALMAGRAARTRAGLSVTPMWWTLSQFVLIVVVIVVVAALLNAYLGLPLPGLILLVLAAIAVYITRSTRLGRALYAVGSNAEGARRFGIPVVGVRIAAFAMGGLLFGIAGVLGAARYSAASYAAFAGGTLLLEAVAAAVLGGISLFGGRGRIAGAVLGALVIGSLGNGLDLMNATTADKLMIEGAILLVAVAIDAIYRRRGARRG